MADVPRSITEMESTAPYPEPLRAKDGEAQLRPLQIELLKLQRTVPDGGRRIVMLFEGRDANGKAELEIPTDDDPLGRIGGQAF